jgi:NAD(P)-dependent dehydrogenase (short-subunit alcohol dehydrogenase family)
MHLEQLVAHSKLPTVLSISALLLFVTPSMVSMCLRITCAAPPALRGSEESIKAAAAKVAAAVGADGLQLLVNNAGIGSSAPAECLSLQEFR